MVRLIQYQRLLPEYSDLSTSYIPLKKLYTLFIILYVVRMMWYCQETRPAQSNDTDHSISGVANWHVNEGFECVNKHYNVS
jgi:hypothetical protein